MHRSVWLVLVLVGCKGAETRSTQPVATLEAPNWVVKEVNGVQTRMPLSSLPVAKSTVDLLTMNATGSQLVRMEGNDLRITMQWGRGMISFTCSARGRDNRVVVSEDFAQSEPVLLWCE